MLKLLLWRENDELSNISIVSESDTRSRTMEQIVRLFACLFGFYGISAFVGYLMQNSVLYR